MLGKSDSSRCPICGSQDFLQAEAEKNWNKTETLKCVGCGTEFPAEGIAVQREVEGVSILGEAPKPKGVRW
jgi:Zn ribbon nucleic-acid-binding protein